MNILFTYPTLFNPKAGGVERVTDILAREFINLGHNVFYLHNKRDEQLMAYEFPTQPQWFPEVDYHSDRNKCFFTDYITTNNIDIVINQTGAFSDSILYCHTQGTKAKVISVVHSNPLQNYEHLFNSIVFRRNRSCSETVKAFIKFLIYPYLKRQYFQRLVNHYNWLTSGNTDRIVILSQHFVKNFRRIAPKIQSHQLNWIGNPCPYPKFENKQKDKIILFVGRLTRTQKRPDRIIKIWKKLCVKHPDWKLIIIGDGPESAKLKIMATNISNIEFTGFCDPLPYYKKASILCMTSNFEGFGMVLLEAMNNGCVPMAFNSFASIRDLITCEQQIVSPFNLDEYAMKLDKIITNKPLLSQLQTKGYEIAQRYDPKEIAQEWIKLFHKVQGGI